MAAPQKAGRYELLEELGRGAMGVVYKAYDPVIGRTVAVKTMRLSAEGTGMTREELVARFQTEARAAGLLTHPNIVVVYDAGEEEGLFYITMEYVEGHSLQALLDAKQSFPLPRTLRILEQACAALEFAHQRNVVHRDIKPANLMLTADETVKVTDFGTAKILQFGTAQTAHIMGTPSYMSPEQVKGKVVDGRSDIFSLGVILYELVTGEKPFPGQNITTVIYKIINEDPIPPRELDSSIHPGLNYIITRALAKQPEARYQDCGELVELLRNYRDASPSPEATIVMASRETRTATPAQPAAFRPSQVLAQEEPQKRHGSFWLALLLLTIIVAASYRLWPHAKDVWQRGRASWATRATRAASELPAPLTPGATENHATPVPSASAPAPAVAKKTPAVERKPVATKAAEGNPPGPVEKAASSAPAESSAPDSRERTRREALLAEVRSRIERGLTQAGLAGKVRVEAAGDTFTLSGQLTPHEHQQLLRRLRNAPRWVHLIDHIEDTSPPAGEVPGAASPSGQGSSPGPARGAINVATDVPGVAAILRGPRGQVVSQCQTPCRFAELWPGRYVLEISQTGYRPELRILQVTAGSPIEQRIQLQKMSSGLLVTSRPPWAYVFINGERQPEPTPTTIILGPGSYNVMVSKPGFEPYVGQVLLKVDELTRLDVELSPPTQKPPS